ncbi:MAG: malto-oligosyltrehalose trehalohydrolase, partial [Acidobacteriaceae bacterium]|nr:malto-oligosyltrehalose trehalohydrolase [Acidobacteriaceae bacterium]
MHTFEVWAPNAENIAVKIGNALVPLERFEHGWWRGETESARQGTEYWFVIDGGDPVPDPRSAWQPYGIDGASRIVDHSAFPWTDQNWQPKPLSSAIIYELHVGTFSRAGTFKSMAGHLDHVVELGITHVELMPVNQFSGEWGWGYDGVNLYAPHHAYGTPDDLKQLVNACHAKGLAVLLDVVYNHFGPAGCHVNKFGPYFTDAYKTPWGQAVNLDHKGSREVRRFLSDNALMWLRDYHFDGLRLDAVHAFHDQSATHFLEYLSCEVDALASQIGRHLVLIAESDLNDPRIVSSREAGGFGIDAQWSDDFHHALHTLLTGERDGYYEDFGSLNQLAKSLQNPYVYDGAYSRYRDRLHGRRVTENSGHHFLGYAQTHDQIGNRPQGERLCHLLSPGRQKIAAALVLTSPFVPMLFQGEEFGSSSPFQYFTQHADPALAKMVSEGRRKEFITFGWNPNDVPDPQDAATFEHCKLNWDEVEHESHASVLGWYKELIALRKSTSELTDGRMDRVEVNFDAEAQWLVVKRGNVEVVCNLASDPQVIPVCFASPEVICSEEHWKMRAGSIELPGDSVAILSGHRAERASCSS